MLRIAVIGSLVVDMTMQTPRVPRPGDNLHADSFRMGAGGKGANAAAAIVRLGGEALLVGCLGDDELGRFELATIQAEGIDTSGVTLLPDAPTAVAFILVERHGQNTVLVANRTNERLSAAMATAALQPHWSTLDAILVNFESAEETVMAVAQGAQAHGRPVVIDAGPARHYGPSTWLGATVLSPNESEAAALVGYPLGDDAAARQAARDLLATGPQAVVIKRGERGALLLDQAGEWQVPAYRITVVDTTGAGDAFTAALTLTLAEGQPLRQAVRFANAAGALTATRLGTLEAMPTRGEVEALLGQG